MKKKHGGGWKMAYADLTTSLMSLFLILWLTQSLPPKERQEMIKGFQNTKTGKNESSGPPSQEDSALSVPSEKQVEKPLSDTTQQLFKGFKDKVQASNDLQQYTNNISVRETAEGVEINLAESYDKTFFPLSSAVLKPEAVELLNALGTFLEHNTSGMISIGGHTDSVPFSNGDYSNDELAADRANAARRILVRYFPNRLYAVQSFADRKPIVPGDLKDPRNRYISVTLLNKTPA